MTRPVDTDRFSAWRERVARARVLVVGDVMLDRYWFGDVERISPEAPVPVVRIARSEERPGGAANVARNVAALGAQATLLSVTGDDEAGATLARLVAAGVSVPGDSELVRRVQIKSGNRDVVGLDFKWVLGPDIIAERYPEDLVVIERREWGNFYGFLRDWVGREFPATRFAAYFAQLMNRQPVIVKLAGIFAVKKIPTIGRLIQKSDNVHQR